MSAAAAIAGNAAADNLDITISRTLELLQQRLRRLEFLVTGDIAIDDTIDYGNADNRSKDGSNSSNDNQRSKSNKQQSVKQGLRSIDASLRSLSAKCAGARQILELREFFIPAKAPPFTGRNEVNTFEANSALIKDIRKRKKLKKFQRRNIQNCLKGSIAMPRTAILAITLLTMPMRVTTTPKFHKTNTLNSNPVDLIVTYHPHQ